MEEPKKKKPYKKFKNSANQIPVKLKLKKKGVDDWKEYPNIVLDNSRDSYYKRNLPSNRISTTKYSLLNFIPKNLFEQFRRIQNIFFLSVVIISLIPAITPINSWTSWLPLSIVLGITAIKEGFEDFRRFKEDNKVNNKKYIVIKKNGKEKKKKSQNLRVGDFIKVKNEQFFPSDIVPLISSLHDGIIYVETAQLDGETNLKQKKAPPATNKLSESEVINLKGHIQCSRPSAKLEEWTGALEIDGNKYPLKESNLLLRGSKLKNTDWIIGVVVYSGRFTKLSLNQKLPPSKFSTIESRLNKVVISIFLFDLSLLITCCIASGFYNAQVVPESYYLDVHSSATVQAIKDFFSYYVLLSFLIPISLMVTLEVVKFAQGLFMEWDEKMALDPNNVKETGMNPKTTNLNDELALVRYVMSDKTGTLTENCMKFQRVSINGVVYDEAYDGELSRDLDAGGENAEFVRDFLTALAVCQSVVPEYNKKGKLVYKAQSPDEAALCDGAKVNGYTFHTRLQSEIIVNIQGEDTKFEILKEIEFSSERKKMTVIARLPDGRIKVFSKGADSEMYTLLSPSVDDNLRQKTNDDIEGFSKLGLRTLAICSKDITEEEYEDWEREYNEAETSLQNRDQLLKNAAKRIENNFQLLGCTAIEDKLQRNVPETIHNLHRANIKVWVITGDKQETAENIGYSCKLLNNNMELIRINATSYDGCKDLLLSACNHYCSNKKNDYHSNSRKKSSGNQEIAVIIDGKTLEYALSEELSPHFLRITSLCHSVLCCRVSPLQKALIVRIMKDYTKEVCLAIGDGANDVSMIQEAHIGVGIFGKEGTQAARSADYAIREFRHLIRLVTIHGRYNYIRNSGLIHYSIYKNVAAFLVQFWYAFYCGYSATTLYDDWIIAIFNIFFTSIPPFFYAIFEKDLPEEVLYEYPEAYRYVQKGNLFTYTTIAHWMVSAIWNSIVFFFGCVLLLSNEPFYYYGITTGLRLMGAMMSSIAILTVILKMHVISNLWNWITHLGIWGSMSCYVLVFLVQSSLPTLFPTQYFMFEMVVSNPNWWALFFVTIIICHMPEVFFEYIKRQFYPDDWMILQEAYKSKKLEDLKHDLKAVEQLRERKQAQNKEKPNPDADV